MERLRPYFRHSGEKGFWVRATEALNEKTPILPGSFYESELRVDLVNREGKAYSLKLPYMPSNTIDWAGHGERRFDDYDKVMETQTFDLHRHKPGRNVIMFVWHGFSDTLHADSTSSRQPPSTTICVTPSACRPAVVPTPGNGKRW
jgi:hypothetical protein